jgi:hypothetical protein
VLATYAIAPAGWRHNIAYMLGGEPGGPRLNVPELDGGRFIIWASFAIVAWAGSHWSSSPGWIEYRRRTRGAFVVVIPVLVPFLVAPLLGLHAGVKYLAHAMAACCVAAAQPLTMIVRRVLGLLLEYIDLATSRARSGLTQASPFVMAVLIATTGTTTSNRLVTISDLSTVAQVLHDSYGWDVRHMIRGFKAPAASSSSLVSTTSVRNARTGSARLRRTLERLRSSSPSMRLTFRNRCRRAGPSCADSTSRSCC